MKRSLSLFLALVMILALAACGETKEADVVENVDPESNSVVIETPPAIVSGPDTPVATYPSVSVLPTTAPTTAPNPAATTVPAPGNTPGTPGNNGDGTGTGTGDGTGGTDAQDPEEEDPNDKLKPNNPTATQYEIDHGIDGWIFNTENGVNFRVGPSSEYQIIRGLFNGTKILVVDQLTSGWCKIVYDGDVGYVYGRYVTLHNPEDPIIATETPAPTAIIIVP